jgi:capsid protein
MASTQPTTITWLDRAIAFVSPRAGLSRLRARTAAGMLAQRHYEAAAVGRRTQGWNKTAGDANAVVGAAATSLRNVARDLVRNNGYAESAVTTIVDHVVGWGIVPNPRPRNKPALETWKAWADSTTCDADGQHDFAGLQKLALRTVVEAGEVIIRRRIRRPEDNLPLPIRIVNGVELDAIGRRVAYWLFLEHPGSNLSTGKASERVPAENVLHVFRQDRPGQVRGISWFAPVLLRFKDLDDYEDATLMKQRIAACLAVIISDPDGTSTPLGTVDAAAATVDSIEPGMILNRQGGSVEVIQPPAVREYSDFTRTQYRAIAAGLGISYEDLTADFSNVNFSSARMARLRHWARVEDWRWRIVIPQLCVPVWGWVMQAAAIMSRPVAAAADWTAPPLPMIEPGAEALADQRAIRSGLKTLPEALRERGYDPEAVLDEISKTNATIDRLGLILDSDPRTTTQAGNPTPAVTEEPSAPAKPATEDE